LPSASAAARAAPITSSGTPSRSSSTAYQAKASVASSAFSLNFWLSSAWRSWISAKRVLAAPCNSAPPSTKLRIALRCAWRCSVFRVAGSMALYLAYSRSSEPRRVQKAVTRGMASL